MQGLVVCSRTTDCCSYPGLCLHCLTSSYLEVVLEYLISTALSGQSGENKWWLPPFELSSNWQGFPPAYPDKKTVTYPQHLEWLLVGLFHLYLPTEQLCKALWKCRAASELGRAFQPPWAAPAFSVEGPGSCRESCGLAVPPALVPPTRCLHAPAPMLGSNFPPCTGQHKAACHFRTPDASFFNAYYLTTALIYCFGLGFFSPPLSVLAT